MSNVDVVAKEILSDKDAWTTSGKEDFLALLESISLEVEEEMELDETEGLLDVDMGIEDKELGIEDVSSLMSGGYNETEFDTFEDTGNRLY